MLLTRNRFIVEQDTPSSYSGQTGLFTRVNSAEDALEFAAVVATVLANEATRMTILEHLAARLPFELLPGTAQRRTMTVRIEDASIEDALEELLVGVRYSVEYDIDPEDGSRVLSRLLVGEPLSSSVAVRTPLEPRRGNGHDRRRER